MNEALAEINSEMKQILTEVMPMMEAHAQHLQAKEDKEGLDTFTNILELMAMFIKGATLMRNFLRDDGAI